MPNSRRSPLLRLSTLLLACLFIVAACGDDTDGAATSTDDADAIDRGSAAAAGDDLPPEGRGTVTENPDGTRTVTSTFGTATVPAEPERIVSVIGDIDLEAMLALDITPVGAGTQGGTATSGFAPHLDGLVAGIEPLAWADGAPAEAIAALRPDLIIVPDQETADLLDDIAPVVPRGTWVGTEWKQDFLYIGEVLGRREDAAELLAGYEDRAAELAERIAPTIDGTTALSPQVAHDHTQIYVDADDSFSSAVLSELGFELDDLVDADDSEGISVSHEQLERLDADWLFWQVRQDENGDTDREGVGIVRANPLFERLPAVTAGRYVEVPNRPWYFPTILGAQQILDDVEAAVL